MKLKYLHCTRAEQLLACAELLLANKASIAARPEKIEQMKAALGEIAHLRQDNIVLTAMWWITTKIGDEVKHFERSAKSTGRKWILEHGHIEQWQFT